MAAWGVDAPFALILVVLLGGLSASFDEDPELRFKRAGTTVATHSLDELRASLAPEDVRVREPYEEREVTFAALPFGEVLDHVYTPDWRNQPARLLLFTCRDGYQPTLPVQRVLSHRAWLAFERRDAEGFWISKFESGRRQRVDLSPFYLIWDNLEDPQVRMDGDYGWPYQLVGIDLVRAEDHFRRMAPPVDAPDDVRAGFAAFQAHCSRCHKVNGEGGAIGPELNRVVSPVEYRRRDWLERWIASPNEMRPGTRMPPLNPALPDRDATIEQIVTYLEAMAAARRAPGAP